MGKSRPIVFVTTDTDCYVPISHKLNRDGYFRKRWGSYRGGEDDFEMFHRFIYRAHHGEIPEGHEVHHRCNNRACSNPEHLECIPGDEHAILSNQERYAARKASACLYWQETQCTGTHLARQFDVSISIACRWIREWRNQ